MFKKRNKYTYQLDMYRNEGILYMFNLILPWWAKYVAAIALGAAIFIYGYIRGVSHEKTRYDAFVAKTEANAKVAQAHAKQVEQNQQEVTKNVVTQYAKSVDQINSYYKSHPSVVQLRDNSPSCVMPRIPESSEATGTHSAGTSGTAKTSPTGSSEGVSVNLELIGSGLVKLLEKDNWVKQQEEIKR